MVTVCNTRCRWWRPAGRRVLELRLGPRIVADPKICFGKPVIEGTRVSVELVLGHLASGMSVEAVCEEYALTREDVLASLAYAAQMVASEESRPVD